MANCNWLYGGVHICTYYRKVHQFVNNDHHESHIGAAPNLYTAGYSFNSEKRQHNMQYKKSIYFEIRHSLIISRLVPAAEVRLGE